MNLERRIKALESTVITSTKNLMPVLLFRNQGETIEDAWAKHFEGHPEQVGHKDKLMAIVLCPLEA